MLLYNVSWSLDDNLAKGRKKGEKIEFSLAFSVLCRNSHDALKCLDYHFRKRYGFHSKITLDDGSVTLKRSTIDSRGFVATYLLMDDMREPFELSNMKSNCLRINDIFGCLR